MGAIVFIVMAAIVGFIGWLCYLILKGQILGGRYNEAGEKAYGVILGLLGVSLVILIVSSI